MNFRRNYHTTTRQKTPIILDVLSKYCDVTGLLNPVLKYC